MPQWKHGGRIWYVPLFSGSGHIFNSKCVSGIFRFTKRSNNSRAASSLNRNCLWALPVPRTLTVVLEPVRIVESPRLCPLWAFVQGFSFEKQRTPKQIKLAAGYSRGLQLEFLILKFYRTWSNLTLVCPENDGEATEGEGNLLRLASSVLCTSAGRTCAVFSSKLSCGPYILQGMTHIHTIDSPAQCVARY